MSRPRLESNRSDSDARRPRFEALERRDLFSADISLAAAGGVVEITGDDARSAIIVTVERETVADVAVVDGGTTSVFRDTAVFESAANLVLSSINSSGTPASPAFQVGFPILDSSDFRFATDAFAPIDGTIRHEGTVGFNGDSIVVGDFDIKFDAARVSGDNSGFYVVNTVDGALDNLVLFDISNPGGVAIGTGTLDITDADLLVAPEFAAVLADPAFAGADLTGADVGDAQINASTADVLRDVVTVTGQAFGTQINGMDSDSVSVEDFQALNIDLAGGKDRIIIRHSTIRGLRGRRVLRQDRLGPRQDLAEPQRHRRGPGHRHRLGP
jgi:hypothetical protein